MRETLGSHDLVNGPKSAKSFVSIYGSDIEDYSPISQQLSGHES